MTNRRILIGDSEDTTRAQLALTIKIEAGGFIAAEANSGQAIMEELSKEKFTHLIVDIFFSDGNILNILSAAKEKHPSMKILFYSMQSPQVNAAVLKMYNTPYYLSKTADHRTMVKVLNNFLATENNFSRLSQSVSESGPFKHITPRELQVLYYMLNGLGTKKIADTLNLKMNSVSTLKKRLYQKTGVSSFKALIDLCTLYNISY